MNGKNYECYKVIIIDNEYVLFQKLFKKKKQLVIIVSYFKLM